jgi:hypothetical protein
MKRILIVALLMSMLWASASFAAPSYLDAKTIVGGWTIGLSGSDLTSWNWDVTLNAVTGFYGGTIQDAQGFIVYDNNAGTHADSRLGWSLAHVGNGASVQWTRTSHQNYLAPGSQKRFSAAINHLDDPFMVVFHVREVDARGRVTTYYARQCGPPHATPELGTWLLLSLSGLAGTFVIRRRKS